MDKNILINPDNIFKYEILRLNLITINFSILNIQYCQSVAEAFCS